MERTKNVRKNNIIQYIKTKYVKIHWIPNHQLDCQSPFERAPKLELSRPFEPPERPNELDPEPPHPLLPDRPNPDPPQLLPDRPKLDPPPPPPKLDRPKLDPPQLPPDDRPNPLPPHPPVDRP